MAKSKYRVCSIEWPGLAKLVEEAGEVVKEAGKIMGGCDSPERVARLNEELGDLWAAMVFVRSNNLQLDNAVIAAKADEKLNRWYSKRYGAKTNA
jgi:NTP pyrophosphatase (non-canonical NTP hydrolase)